MRYGLPIVGFLALVTAVVYGKIACQFHYGTGEVRSVHATATSVVLVDEWDANADNDDLPEYRTRLIRFDAATGRELDRVDLGHRLDCAPANAGHLWCWGEVLALVRLDDLEVVADAGAYYGEGAPLGPEAPSGEHMRYHDGRMHLRAIDGAWHVVAGSEATPQPTEPPPRREPPEVGRVYTSSVPEAAGFLDPKRLRVREGDLPFVLYAETLRADAGKKLQHDSGTVVELAPKIGLEAYAPAGTDHVLVITEDLAPTVLRLAADGSLVWRTPV